MNTVEEKRREAVKIISQNHSASAKIVKTLLVSILEQCAEAGLNYWEINALGKALQNDDCPIF